MPTQKSFTLEKIIINIIQRKIFHFQSYYKTSPVNYSISCILLSFGSNVPSILAEQNLFYPCLCDFSSVSFANCNKAAFEIIDKMCSNCETQGKQIRSVETQNLICSLRHKIPGQVLRQSTISFSVRKRKRRNEIRIANSCSQ